MMTFETFAAAVRAFAVPVGWKRVKRKRAKTKPTKPRLTLVVDIESEKDWTETFALGHFRMFDRKRQKDHGFFVPDVSTDEQIATLERQLNQRADTGLSGTDSIRVMRREEFLLDIFYKVVHEQKGRLVVFDLPYLISRLAVRWSVARAKPYAGGFSFVLLEYVDEDGVRRDDALYPRIAVKSIDSKRALIGFTSNWIKQPIAGSTEGPKPPKSHRGKFLDTRVLTHALTGEIYQLNDACRAFGVEADEPLRVETAAALKETAVVLRRRTDAIRRLSTKLLQDFNRHPIALPPESAYSPASIAKAYIRAMGVSIPTIDVDPALDLSEQEVLGASMVSYYGGRAEDKIRKMPVPVTYCDFVSMYPTVNALMGLWKLLTAKRIVARDVTEETAELLSSIDQSDCFRPETWKKLHVLVKIIPDSDILPVRVKYGKGKNAGFTIGLNYVTSSTPMWFTLADAIASKILTGKAPLIDQAIGFEVAEKRTDLDPVSFHGSVDIDPEKDDFFKKIVEERKKVEFESDMDAEQAKALAAFLKTLDNAGSYGIFVELNRQERKEVDVEVFGLESYGCTINHAEIPGEFFFPLLGTLITGAARLMLVLLESEVGQRDGEYAFMDTDSIAIVSSEDGGLIFCPGGNFGSEGGQDTIQALSFKDVDEIVEKFAQLNPYDPHLVPGSILRLEDENFGANGTNRGERVQLWCYAISSKRYVLFNLDDEKVTLRKCSEHGLGNYLPPSDPGSGEPVHDWIENAWMQMLGMEIPGLARDDPKWGNQVVRTRLRISTPEMLRWLDPINDGQQGYGESVKPFNSIEHAPLDVMFGRPRHGKTKICLVAPAMWSPQSNREWINIHAPSEDMVRLVPPGRSSRAPNVYVGLPYSDLILGYSHTPEPKSLGPDGMPCHQRTRGLLFRRHIEIGDLVHIGKEANDLDLVEAGLVTDEESVLTTYIQDPWEIVKKVLADIPARVIIEKTGCSQSSAYNWKQGKGSPSGEYLPRLIEVAAGAARESFRSAGYARIPADDMMAVRLYARYLDLEKSRRRHELPEH